MIADFKSWYLDFVEDNKKLNGSTVEYVMLHIHTHTCTHVYIHTDTHVYTLIYKCILWNESSITLNNTIIQQQTILKLHWIIL